MRSAVRPGPADKKARGSSSYSIAGFCHKKGERTQPAAVPIAGGIYHVPQSTGSPAYDLMADIESLYKKRDGNVLIEIKLTAIMQLFNSFDPSPFHEKELDHDAEHYIVDTVNDFPKKTQFAIVIHLPADLADSPEGRSLPAAIRNHFEYRMLVAERKYRQRLKYGRMILLIGLTFLFISIIAGRAILQMGDSLLYVLVADALMITGWASMWEPVTVLLYELWPIIQTKKVYERISTMDIEVQPV